jgi:hypothetical protein
MPTQLRIIHATDFLIATPQGQVDFENSKRILLKLAAATNGDGSHEILLDVRKANTAFSATDLWRLAREVSHRRTAFHGQDRGALSSGSSQPGRFFRTVCPEPGLARPRLHVL